MNPKKHFRFFAIPPMKRTAVIALIVTAVTLMILGVFGYINQRINRPEEVTPQISKQGLIQVRRVVSQVKESKFGSSKRGKLLTAEIEAFLQRDAVRFSPNLGKEALLRKETGAKPVLYVGVIKGLQGILFPDHEELAECLYHECLHALQNSRRMSLEEECDAFCAAAEARAVIEKKEPEWPLKRDGKVIWEWVKDSYTDVPSNPEYKPIGITQKELKFRANIPDMPSRR